MANELFRLQESQIKALGEAKAWALVICGFLRKFFAELREDCPHQVADAIAGLLGYRSDNPLPERLETIGFFINQVGIPVKVPRFVCGKTVSVRSTNCPSAHEGAVRFWDEIRGFLFHKIGELCPELGLAPAPFDVGVGLMPHCENLRRGLGEALEYGVDGLMDAIERESQAAMEVCNANLVSAVAGRTEHDERKSEGNGGADSTRKQPPTDPNVKRKEVMDGLEPADRKAYLAFQYAEKMAEKQLQDHEAYDWLKENGIETDKSDVGELADYDLRTFETWAKQLRNARKPLGEQKYTRRAGRGKGRSIVTGQEIECPGRDGR